MSAAIGHKLEIFKAIISNINKCIVIDMFAIAQQLVKGQ